MNRNHFKPLKRCRGTSETRHRSAFATASFILAASLFAVLLAACPSTTPTPENAVPGVPTAVTANAGDGQVTVSWTAPADRGYTGGDGTPGVISKYTVYHSESTISDLTAAGVTKVDVNSGTTKDVTLTNGTMYYFKVTATNAFGESAPSDEKTATPIDTTPPTFELSDITAGSQNTLTLIASEAITLLGADAAANAGKLTVKNDAAGASPATLTVSTVALESDETTVTITINSAAAFVATQEVSVAIEADFAADKAATPNNNIAATVKTTVAAAPPTVTSVAIPEGNQGLDVSGTVQLSAAVTGTNNPSQDVTWSTSDNTVATVSTTGLVTVAAGATGGQTADITATSTADATKKDTITVTVNAATVASVAINEGNQGLDVSGTVQLSAAVSGNNNPSQDVTWSTSDNTVATVSTTGLVTVAAGAAGGQTADITATSTADATKKDTITVTVNAATVASVAINEGNQGLDVSGTVQLSAAVSGNNNPSQDVTWSTSDNTVATVSTTGLVTVAAGAAGGQTADITATSTADATKKDTITVTVNAATVASVAINEGNQGLDVSGTVQLSAAVTGSNNPSQDVTWSTSDNTVATVSTTGLVTVVATAMGGNTATITATSTEDNTKTASITVTVNAATVTSVTINEGDQNVSLAGTRIVQLSVTVTGTNNPSQDVTWSTTSAPGFMTVSADGLVTVATTASIGAWGTIRATSTADDTKTASVRITIDP